MIVIALLLPALLGFLILALFLREDRKTGQLERLCLSYPVGAGLLTIQMFILGLLRIPLTLLYTALPVIIEITVLSLYIALKKIVFLPKPSYGLFEELSARGNNVLKKAVLIILTAWAGIKIGSVFVETGLRPIYAWDTWANWSVGAKLFYFTHGLLLDGPAQDFFSRGAVLRITSYPLLNPLLQTWISLWTGGFDEVLVKFWNPVFLVSGTVYLYLLTSKALNRTAAMALLVMFLSSPLLSYHAIEAYSDLPLSVYLLFTSVAFLYAMRGREAYWPLIALFSAESMFTKEEALFFAAPLLLSAALFLWRSSERSRQNWRSIATLFAPLLLIVPWYVFKLIYNLNVGANTVTLAFTFKPEVFWQAAQQIMSLDNFNVFYFAFPFLLLVADKPTREFLRLFAVVAWYALFFMMLYAFTTIYNHHFNSGTIFYRNLLTYYPVVVFLSVLLIERIPFTVPQKVITARSKQKR